MSGLTPSQITAVEAAQDRWLEWIFSTRPANRMQAEAGVRQTYRTAGVAEPALFLWFDDMLQALLAVEQLSDYRESNWMLPAEALALREEVRRTVRRTLGLRKWDQVLRAVGPEQTPHRYEERRHQGLSLAVAVPREDSLQTGLPGSTGDPPAFHAAIEVAAKAVEHAGREYHQDLVRAAGRQAGPGIPGHGAIGLVPSVYNHYRFDLLFRHDCLFHICGERASGAYDGLRRTVQHSLAWWPFAKAAVLCDRPNSLHRDAQGRLHHQTAPAVTFPGGLELFAWHGTAVPGEAILHPEALKRTAVRTENDPRVRAALMEIYGVERYHRELRPPPKRKPAHPLAAELPDLPEDRIEALRSYGPLPYLERYLSGERREVWAALSGLGPGVRDQPFAADALAVGYATMLRVRQNLDRLVKHLSELGLAPEPEARKSNVVPFGVARWRLWTKGTIAPSREELLPLQPPEIGLRNGMRRLEKDAGELPLSLRSFYEVVGSIDLRGTLQVVPFSQLLRQWDESPPDVGVDGVPFVAQISAAHRITLPAPGMDVALSGGLAFIDYLRQAFPPYAASLDGLVDF